VPYVVVPNKAEIPVFFNNATNEFISLKTGSALEVGIYGMSVKWSISMSST
jgi:hypothetical protein